MNRQEYIDKIKQMSAGSMGGQDSYFTGHLPRFETQLDMFDNELKDAPLNLVYDLGTNFPYVSLYLNLTRGSKVVFGAYGLEESRTINPQVQAVNFNLIKPVIMPRADLVITTEVLEHLPCNLFRTRSFVIDTVKEGGYWLVSFPLGGQNASGYGDDLPYNPEERSFSPHLREFTEQTARDFYLGSGFKLVKEAITFTQQYGGNIMNVLLRKELYA